jgi:hypothetical protein
MFYHLVTATAARVVKLTTVGTRPVLTLFGSGDRVGIIAVAIPSRTVTRGARLGCRFMFFVALGRAELSGGLGLADAARLRHEHSSGRTKGEA